MKVRTSRPKISRRLCAAGLAALLGGACSSGSQATPDDVQREAEAQFHRAVFLLDQGNLIESWRAVQEMNGIVDAFLDPDPRTGRRSGDAAVAMGRPLRDWQKEWNERYRLSVQTAWPAIRKAIEDESVDVALLKGYVSEFLGRSHVTRVNDEYRRLEGVFRARRAQQYWYSCEEVGDLCAVVRDAVTARMPQGIVTTSWTGSRDDYRGTVDVKIRVLREVTYTRGNEKRGRLPQAVAVQVEVATANGSSKWDGVHTFEIEGDLPSRAAPHELARISQQHWDDLRRDLEEKMAAWPGPAP
jgi:hypothetical protein